MRHVALLLLLLSACHPRAVPPPEPLPPEEPAGQSPAPGDAG
ncbi:CapA family protein, partial [Myxococcus xanthus]|nr:CapA family protein [Myxococcus xanthus]